MSEDLIRYPLGTMQSALAAPRPYEDCIASIAAFPSLLRELVDGISDAQLSAKYRPGGWTVRQLVHHCADSHMHALLRTKWALTMRTVQVSGYDEAATAELVDYSLPVAPSLCLLDGLHLRFAALLSDASIVQRQRTYHHIGHNRDFTVAETAVMYDWHGRHHLAHVRAALKG